MRMACEGPGRYRIGEYTITHESRTMWRVRWDPLTETYDRNSGIDMDAFLTLRSARIHVEQEIESSANDEAVAINRRVSTDATSTK